MTAADLRRWMLAPFAIFVAFLAAGVGAAVVAALLDVWELPLSGFASAFAVVYAASVAAPAHKQAFAPCVF